MRIVCYPRNEMAELSGSAEDLARLARAVADGEGVVRTSPSADERDLAGAEVGDAPGPGVLVRLDVSRRVLVISGDAPARAVLADNLRAMADEDDGGHLHIEHFPDHPYLVEGSLPLVVISPHGGMPRR
ncbi:hypothetical protein [Kitasatospora sp. NPDC093558]|uniref:Imm32 family immunity protein n=1 Tax=Kitasatospora sp. NPDC093558 TaxID=3155201 RepID=UPI00343D14C2